jgi:protein-S-isoprenylcysteine O-methyltransferase Ste14
MFPVLVYVYYRLSIREESEVLKIFGDEYRKYMKRMPMFIPWMSEKTAVKEKFYEYHH